MKEKCSLVLESNEKVTEDDLAVMEGMLRRCPIVFCLFKNRSVHVREIGTIGALQCMLANMYMEEILQQEHSLFSEKTV